MEENFIQECQFWNRLQSLFSGEKVLHVGAALASKELVPWIFEFHGMPVASVAKDAASNIKLGNMIPGNRKRSGYVTLCPERPLFRRRAKC